MRYRVELHNSQGLLDVRIVDNQEDIGLAVRELACELNDFYPGDKIIVLEEATP